MGNRRWHRAGSWLAEAVVVVVLLVVAGVTSLPVAGQVVSYVTLEGVDDRRADALERRAGRLHTLADRYGEAARLYERASGLRRAGDPRAIHSMNLASRLYHHAGEQEAAIRVLDRLAQLSLALGDVVQAGNALADVAWILGRQGFEEEAIVYARRAELLASSPLLREDERRALRVRIGLGAR